MKNRTKILSLILACVLLTLSLASCAAKNMSPEDAGPTNQAPSYSDPGATPERGEDEGADRPTGPDNPFISTDVQNVSTFSADVDTASYTYFRKLVNAGYNLTALQNASSAFRTEEFINYFRYSVPTPNEGELFGTNMTLTPCPWNSENLLLRISLQAETTVNTAGNNLVFLIDVSGSMNSSEKLGLLQSTFSYLVGNLGANDVISIVTYSGREAVVLDGCPGAESERIMNAINSLRASGSTNGEAGLSEAYRIAESHFIEGGNNRIIMASDGDLNVGISSEDELKRFIEGKRDAGIYLSVLGFGSGNYRDAKMEALADNGNGVYYYIDGVSEAERVFGTDLLGTLYTVGEDVKLQLTFNKELVESYRLIGYENRLLNQEDFEDDTKDAGEVGAGHQVTVCYELCMKEIAVADGEQQSPSTALATLAVRYKKPGEAISLLNEYPIDTSLFGEVNADTQFISCVIRACMILRGSQYAGEDMLEAIVEDLRALDLTAYPDRTEFLTLLEKLIQADT